MSDDQDEERRLNIPFLNQDDEVIAIAYLAKNGEVHSDPRPGSIAVALITTPPGVESTAAVRLLPTKTA
jgi:hypothetical protein